MKTHSIAVLFVICMGGLFPIESLHAQDFWSVHWLPHPCNVPDLILDSNGNLFVACSQAGLFRSTNSGRTFEKLNFNHSVYYRFEKNRKDNLFYGTDGAGIWRSNDRGNNWFKIGLNRKKVVDIEIIHDTVIFVGSNDEGIYRSFDDGKTWELKWAWYPGMPRMHYNKVTSTLYCWPYGKLFKTIDLGETWTEVLHPWRAERDTSMITAMAANSRGEIFTAITYGTEDKLTAIMRSSDGGDTWIETGFGPSDVFRIVINSLDHIFVAMNVGVLRSTDNGVSRDRINEGLGFRYVRSLALGPDERLYAGILGYIAISIQSTVVGTEPIPHPQELSLSQNYPNPAYDLTSVSFSLPQSGAVSLTLHNILGERVQTVIGGDHLPPGTHGATLDVSTLPAGVYVLRLHVAGRMVSRVILVE